MNRQQKQADPNVFVIFGGTGDLSRRKLLPALGRLFHNNELGPRAQVIGVARSTEHTDASFRQLVRECLTSFASELSSEDVDGFVGRCHFQTIGRSTKEEFQTLKVRIEQIEAANGLAQNRTFYLSLPPQAFTDTVEGFHATDLHNEDRGWTRIVLEKPFGTDLASARKLNETVHRVFDERQIYRIDHYLGKDTVQNLLVLRFANALFESVWNRDRIEAVQITVAESLGVGTRAGYYDSSGAMRDMIENHMTQLLTLVAMEVPSTYEADAIRYEKIKVLRSLAPIGDEDVVFGQYAPGQIDGQDVAGYLDEDGVPPGSQTETFVSMKLHVNNWRWQGVPFYLRTGKRLPHRSTRIAIRFRDVPVRLFETMGGAGMDTGDILMVTLQPQEGFSLHFDVKRPGSPLALQRIPLRFQYGELFEDMPEAYQTLILDILLGDQTLFVHSDEVEEAWRVYASLIDNPPRPRPYVSGSWGPAEADHLAIPERDVWGLPSD